MTDSMLWNTKNSKRNFISNTIINQRNDDLRKIRRTDSVVVYHEMLSWHKKDSGNLTMEKMKDMTERYINLKNPNGMYLAAPHYDKDHYHVHICTSGVEYKSGNASRISKKQYAELKLAIQDYQIQQYPELKSIENHGGGDRIKITDREYQLKQKSGRMMDKHRLIIKLESCYQKAESEKDFIRLIKHHGIETYKRNNVLVGVIFGARKYRLRRLGLDSKRLHHLHKRLEHIQILEEYRSSIHENKQRESKAL